MNSERKNVAIIADYCDRLIKGDFSALHDLVSPQWLTHAMPTVFLRAFAAITKPIDGERIFFEQVIQAFSERQLILHKNMAIDSDHVVINYTIEGIHNGANFFDIPPSGQKEKIDGTALFRLEKGKIIEHWGGPTCCTCTGYIKFPL